MSIKNIKPTHKGGFHQSYFEPVDKQKYKGDYPIICRSLLESKFCTYLDQNNLVTQWASEPFSIKYLNQWDKKHHRYYPDFVFTNDSSTVIVEVKSSNHLKKPLPPKRKTIKSVKNYNYALKMYITNASKIVAIRKYADDNNYKFILVTEKELKKLI